MIDFDTVSAYSQIKRMQEMLARMQEQLRIAGKDPSISSMSPGSRMSRSSLDTDSVIDV
jgi:hypothetical protein